MTERSGQAARPVEAQRFSDKAEGAYRTISEVANELELPQHVLRFWESRFGQIRPLKRGGGRRYYRPEDISLLKGIQHLLYNEGYTIKGVQKLLKAQGVRSIQEIAGGRVSASSFESDEEVEDTTIESADITPFVRADNGKNDEIFLASDDSANALPLFPTIQKSDEGVTVTAVSAEPVDIGLERLRQIRDELIICRNALQSD